MSKELLALAVAAAVTVAGTAAAMAQDSGSSAQVETIVVTAQRRVENLQKVAISAEVVGATQIRTQNLNSLADISISAPSVHVITGAGTNDLFIRGIGSSPNQGFDQSVGLFIDDIYHGRSRTSSATFLDLDHLEILKGPQNTYFGNNAIAGAFNIVSQKPTSDAGGWLRGLYGPYGGRYAVEGAVNQPVTDRLAIRIAGSLNGTGGWVTNVGTGGKEPDTRDLAGRVTVAYHPTDAFDVSLKVEGSRNRDHSGVYKTLYACPPMLPLQPAGFCATALSLGEPVGDPSKVDESAGQSIALDTKEAVLTANYHVAAGTFTSVTGYYDYTFNENLDGDSTPLTLLNIRQHETYDQFSQDLRFASTLGEPIEFVVGAYYQRGNLRTIQDVDQFFVTPILQSIPPFAPLVPYLPLGQTIDYRQPERNYSVFGVATWNVSDALKLTGGLRQSWVRKRYDRVLFYGTSTQDYGGIVPLPAAVANLPTALGLGVPGTLDGSRLDKQLMPSARVEYQVRPSVLGYLSFSHGFKAGGFNPVDTTGLASNVPFEPEKVNAYEVGVKSKLFDNRVLLNVAGFLSNYSNLQVSTNISSTGALISVVRNSASARSQGVELEAQWAIDDHLRLSGNATYLRSRYLNNPGVTPSVAQALAGLLTTNLRGQPTEYAPTWSGEVVGDYARTITGAYRLDVQLGVYFSTRYFYNAANDPLLRQGGYARLDGRITIANSDAGLSLDIVGKNLNDRRIVTFGSYGPATPGSAQRQFQQPRNIAVQVRYQW